MNAPFSIKYAANNITRAGITLNGGLQSVSLEGENVILTGRTRVTITTPSMTFKNSSNNPIVVGGIATPVNSTEAANKAYVDFKTGIIGNVVDTTLTLGSTVDSIKSQGALNIETGNINTNPLSLLGNGLYLNSASDIYLTPTNTGKALYKNYEIATLNDIETKTIHRIHDLNFLLGRNNLVTTDSDVSLGTGWSGSISEGFTHSPGTPQNPNTEPIDITLDISAGKSYIVEFDYTNNAGAFGFTAKLGGSDPVDVYNGTSHVTIGFTTVTTGHLILTPFNTYNGTVTNISCRKVGATGGTNFTFTVDNFRESKLASELTGFWNIAIGPEALGSNINGSRNIATGKAALSQLTTGTRNLAYGTYVLPQLKKGDENIGIGADAGLYIQEATSSIFLGKASGGRIKKSNRNIAIGPNALYGDADSTPTSNIGIGQNTGYKMTTASSNILIGYNAGYNLTSGYRNIVIGNNVLADKLTTAHDIILIGPITNLANPGYNMGIALGYGATITKSKQIVIGSMTNDGTNKVLTYNETLIYGTLKTTLDGVTIDEVATKRDINNAVGDIESALILLRGGNAS